jgi:hypothetical protein
MLFLRYYLWIAPYILLGFVLLASLQKRLHKELPLFCVFIISEVLRFVLLFTVSRLITDYSIGVYVWLLTCTAAIEVPLRLGVIYEVAHKLFFSQTSLKRILRPVFAWTLAGLVLAGAITAGLLRDISRETIGNAFGVLDFSSGLVQAGILVALFLFSRALRISWRSRVTGVALGFGISACINLATATLRSALGSSAFIAVDITQMAAFHVAAVVWLVYLLLPDSKPAFTGGGLDESGLQYWNQELQRMARQ